ncbi:MAG: alpha/beta fold hydrolase [Chloroflexi bacterium]|nr:alpha/beta fold hydrolase [Chloroflexota bacterium]
MERKRISVATYVIVHGSWGGGWQWRETATHLRAAGHEVFTPTLTGLGERKHLLTPDVGLETHVQDILGVLNAEDLRDVVLVGSSIGGVVSTAVAHRTPERLRHMIYVDAIVPEDGQSAADVLGAEAMAQIEKLARTAGDGWRVPGPPDGRHTDHPLKALTDRVRLDNPAAGALPRTYIRCTQVFTDWRAVANPALAGCAAKARAHGWRYHELDTEHAVWRTGPAQLAALLQTAA